jgi:hypothetical protein
MAGLFTTLVVFMAGAVSCASGSAGGDPQPDGGPPSDGATPDATLESSSDAPGEAAVDSSLPEAAPVVEGGAGDADETGAGDASLDTGEGGNDGGGMDSTTPVDTGTGMDAAMDAEAGISGTFTIVNHSTGYLVDNAGGSTSSGTSVIQWQLDVPAATNQQWTSVAVSGGAVLLFNKLSNLVLDVSGMKVDQASVVGGSTTQEWTFTPSGTAGYYTITSVGGGGVLTSPSPSEGAQLVINVGTGSPSQEWQVVPVP